MRKGKKIAIVAALSASLLGGLFSFTAKSDNTAQAASATNLLSYSNAVGRVGTCINSWQLRDSSLLKQVKEQYNSVTLENENKPDALLGQSATLISVNDAKNLGYYIPANYTESRVPKINFNTVDEALKICSQNNLGYRAHTLVWHSQTPSWLFNDSYSGNGRRVSKNVMDARMEFYVKTVIKHVYSNQYGDCCYAWDIANEYLHASQCGWTDIYGGVSTQPEFLRKAFTYADEMLKELGKRDDVSIFYNDYNEYMEVDKIIPMINYINANGKVCNGVGCQSHLDTSFPSIDYYMTALNKFIKAGFEIQITELDCTNNSESTQAKYMYDLMKGILTAKKNGGNITGITLWGMYDSMSWRSSQSPLLFKNNMNSPKQSYTQVLKAYDDVYGNYTPTAKPTTKPTTAPTSRPTTTPTSRPTVKPSSQPSTGNVAASLVVENEWNDGAVCQLTITNKTGKTLNSWSLALTCSREIQAVWTAELASKTGDTYIIHSPEWGAPLKNGDSYIITFMVGPGGTIEVPSCNIK